MATFDYFVADRDQLLATHENTRRGVVYHNLAKRYDLTAVARRAGSVCIFDYQELSPAGSFYLDSVSGEIREYFSDAAGDYEVVAGTGI